MSLVGKFKELFFEEEVVEPPKTNDLKIEEKKEEKIEEKEPVEDLERDTYKSEPTFKFPVIFEEEDLKPAVNTKKLYSIKKEKKEEGDVKFKASPIISPIYGILDKNYKSEEITDKSESPDYENKREPKAVDIDTVRQKAFGTLEEDLEHTILETGNYIYGMDEEKTEEKKLEEINDLAEDMGLGGEKEPTVGEVDENYKEYGFEFNKPEKKTEEDLQKTEVLDDDLFEMINSMYNKEDE